MITLGVEDVPLPPTQEKETSTVPTEQEPLANMSQPGQFVQEKLFKDNFTPPRPQSRCGFYPPEPPPLKTFHLEHELMPGQMLPEDLTVGQLLTVLQNRGWPLGQAILELRLVADPGKF